jgi:hypothetical protein
MCRTLNREAIKAKAVQAGPIRDTSRTVAAVALKRHGTEQSYAHLSVGTDDLKQ